MCPPPPESTPATDPTSARTLAAKRPSRNSPTSRSARRGSAVAGSVWGGEVRNPDSPPPPRGGEGTGTAAAVAAPLRHSAVSPATAQQGQALQVPQLLPGVHGLGLAADPPLGSRHQARQGLLLQHVRPRLYLGEPGGALGIHPQPQNTLSPGFIAFLLLLPQETYLMKHMSKHTVVEHLVSQHSPQRTESPGIPVRISLI